MKSKALELLSGIDLDHRFYKRCEQFISLLQQWGSTHNLTSQLDTHLIERNIIDSVYPLQFIDTFGAFADIGTGAGYPGMIIAIARPNCRAVMIEPRIKRVAFLNFVKNSLALDNVTILCDRVENINDQSFDLITSRASMSTDLLLNLTESITTPLSQFLLYKGSQVQEEIPHTLELNHRIVNYCDRNYLHLYPSKNRV